MTQAQTVAKGDILAEDTHLITRENLVRYAGAAGDFNAIHYSDKAADDAGLPGVLAHGMLTAALTLQTVSNWLGGDSTRILSYETRFTRPVVVDAAGGAKVVVTAKVGKVEADTMRVDLIVKRDESAVLGKTQATVVYR